MFRLALDLLSESGGCRRIWVEQCAQRGRRRSLPTYPLRTGRPSGDVSEAMMREEG